MRRFYVLIFLLSLCLGAFSQEITVRFTGQLNGTSYCRLDSVKVTNLTRDWTETVEYPDTIIVLGGTVGTDLNIVATQGLGQNIPNPFDCETRVELSVSQRENVRMQLLDASGKQYAEYNGSLDAGVHTFDISAANPQTYILNAVVGDKSYSIRMVNMGSGCGSSIKYAGISGCITAKLTSTNEFRTGDNMRYEGYTTIGGQPVASEVKEQAQVVSQYVTLSFTHYSIPAVETLAATDITTTSVTLHGNITYDGGSAITARGFYWGTAVDNLSQMVSAESGAGEYSAELTGLTLGTYYYCAFATNSTGASTGEILSFTVAELPTVQTNAASSITATGATLSGNVTSDGGATVTSRGFLYGTNSSNLTQTAQSGSGTGSYTKSLTGLSANTTYYYKAYAINSIGTSYGEVMSFTTSCDCGGSYKVTDRDGNQYGTVLIGNQCWMQENLRTTHYANGTSINLGSSTSTTTAYRYYPNNNSSNVSTYGYLYNWKAVMGSSSSSSSNPSGVQGICPTGWHVPSNAEWTQLVNYLKTQSQYQCGSSTANIGKSLAATSGWNSSSTTCAVGNTQANNNSSGFSAKPAGCYWGTYGYMGAESLFWSTNESTSESAYFQRLKYNSAISDNGSDTKVHGYSVRCVRD
jgi:Fibrobacter succinogenes major domain (Fib_succ_major).